jgi:signal peptidase
VRFRTQGDASEDPDLALVSPANLVGEVWFSLPLLGYLVAFIRTPVGYLTLIGLPALLIILGEWWEIVRAPPTPRRRRVAPVPLRAGGVD